MEISWKTSRAEEIEVLRILDRYRRLVLLGRARLPLEAGRLLVGPDCAYHLYFRQAPPLRSGSRKRGGRKGRRRSPPRAKASSPRTRPRHPSRRR